MTVALIATFGRRDVAARDRLGRRVDREFRLAGIVGEADRAVEVAFHRLQRQRRQRADIGKLEVDRAERQEFFVEHEVAGDAVLSKRQRQVP